MFDGEKSRETRCGVTGVRCVSYQSYLQPIYRNTPIHKLV